MEKLITNKVPFRVSARTAKLIGLENFSTEEGAIIELVKNTFDADAKYCILIFDRKYKTTVDSEGTSRSVLDQEASNIYVIDNGIGMTKEIITKHWMTIGTDNKLYEHLSRDGRIKTVRKELDASL